MINLRSTTPSPQSTHSDGLEANRSISFASFAAHDSLGILGDIGQPLGNDTELEELEATDDQPPLTEDHDASARVDVETLTTAVM